MKNNLTYSLDQIKKFNDSEWQEFRKMRWGQKQETYNDKNNIPDWFWPAQKEKDNEIRRKAWAKKCNAYAQSTTPADWFMPSKKEYIEFLEKVEIRKAKILEKKAAKK